MSLTGMTDKFHSGFRVVVVEVRWTLRGRPDPESKEFWTQSRRHYGHSLSYQRPTPIGVTPPSLRL